jgi:hypothetical protein
MLEQGGNMSEFEEKKNGSTAGAMWVIAGLLAIGILYLVFSNNNQVGKAQQTQRQDEQVRLSETWTGDSCSVILEGTYIFETETFCFRIVSTDNTREVRAVSLSSFDQTISIPLVADLHEVGLLRGDGANGRQHNGCVRISLAMFERAKGNLGFTSSARRTRR